MASIGTVAAIISLRQLTRQTAPENLHKTYCSERVKGNLTEVIVIFAEEEKG